MHSGAQTTELTWPKWNHSILSTLPMEQQQQILPGKSCFPSLLRSWTLQALQVFVLSAALPVLFLCNWCTTNCVYTVLNSWWCTFNKKHSKLLSLVRGQLLQEEMNSVVPIVCLLQPVIPGEVSAVPTVTRHGSVGTNEPVLNALHVHMWEFFLCKPSFIHQFTFSWRKQWNVSTVTRMKHMDMAGRLHLASLTLNDIH